MPFEEWAFLKVWNNVHLESEGFCVGKMHWCECLLLFLLLRQELYLRNWFLLWWRRSLTFLLEECVCWHFVWAFFPQQDIMVVNFKTLLMGIASEYTPWLYPVEGSVHFSAVGGLGTKFQKTLVNIMATKILPLSVSLCFWREWRTC